MLYEVTCEWFPRNTVVKTHDYLIFPPQYAPPTIASYRDFRDCVVSHWRFRCKPEPDQQMTEEEVRFFCGFYKRTAFVLDQYAEERKPLLIRYETWVDKAVDLIAMVAAHFGIQEPRPEELADKFSIAECRKRFEPGHVHDGDSGVWASRVPTNLHGLLDRLLGPELSRWGYL